MKHEDMDMDYTGIGTCGTFPPEGVLGAWSYENFDAGIYTLINSTTR